MKISKKVSSLAFKGRGLFWGFFAAGILIFPGHFNIIRFICGIILVLLGQLLRFWAAGFIPKYRTETIGAPVLITWGPYAYVRNPLYAGNALMGLGWSLMVSWGWVGAFAAAFFLLYSLIVIPAEESFLGEKFGSSYTEYKSKVPALFPILGAPLRAANQNARPFDAAQAWAEEIYSIRVNIVVTVIIFIRLFLL
ncbi:MAG: isoprenylcysteine carboxylmethyltransferase family protein [Cloacibacillus sp.]